MKRQRQWLTRWASFLTGICIGLLIVAPVLASTELARALSTSTLLQSSQSLLEVAAMLWSAWLIRQTLSTSKRSR
ncbi:MAG TPA: hypothetical protein VGN65_14600 [Casimicrobiaceae bacterium]|jgi:hypothetical protein